MCVLSFNENMSLQCILSQKCSNNFGAKVKGINSGQARWSLNSTWTLPKLFDPRNISFFSLSLAFISIVLSYQICYVNGITQYVTFLIDFFFYSA